MCKSFFTFTKGFLCCLVVTAMSCTTDEINDLKETEVPHFQSLSVHEQVQNLHSSFLSSATRGVFTNYPNYYGGAFVNENAQLVVSVTDDPELYKSDLIKRVGNDNFIIKKCTYSYRYLLNEMEKLNSFFFDTDNSKLKEELQFKNYYIDTDRNRIYIILGDCSPENIEKFNTTVATSSTFEYEEDMDGMVGGYNSEVSNLLNHVLTSPPLSYFCINYYIRLGVDGTTASDFYVMLDGYQIFIKSFQCANANPSGRYDMYMYTRTRLSNNQDIGVDMVRQQMATYTYNKVLQDRGILITARSGYADLLEYLFRMADQ